MTRTSSTRRPGRAARPVPPGSLVLFDLDPPTPAGQPQAPTTHPARGPITDDTKAILDTLNADPDLDHDRRAIVTAIVAEAHDHSGLVDPNRVRDRLAGPNGRPNLTRPQVVGPLYALLVRRGVLAFTGWVRSTDRASRNSGRPVPAYRLIRIPSRTDAAA